ncbi:MAG: DUF1330 domain-containing protein [Rhizobiales bacterium]|nr:DUF1330 domain-containing protein [Hyphomicrobiales bacterium]
MPAYVIARINVTHPEKYEGYKALSPGAIAAYGGKFLARGGEVSVLEGEPEDRRVVIVEFPSVEQAKVFYDSPEYTEARAARAGAAEGQFLLVEGV